MDLKLNPDFLHKVCYRSTFRTSFLQLSAYRGLGLISCLLQLGIVWYFWWPQVHKPLYYLTIWGNLMLAIYLLLALICSKHSNPTLERANHLLYQATAPTLVLIMIFFWTALLPFFLLMLEQDPDHFWFHLVLNVGLHFITPLFGALEIYYNQVCVKPKDTLLVCGVLALVYMTVNYSATIAEGAPIYPPVDWETYLTPVSIAFALLLEYLGYYVVRKIWMYKVVAQMTVTSKKE